ncbi:hypothetical protein [Micromonospora sp. CB01531]|uniref:hypothetical protein n=1 Tax=Micromonospora sp. CB01531 TaxID=1718947 RepID=UPI000A9F2991|nr:hypothetical protein [Micromonospora sp. CB01531]
MSQQPSTPAISSTPARNPAFKKGLPSQGLSVAESSASKLWNIARLGMTSKEAFAKQLGWNRASGNHWDTRIALLRGFKLINIDGEQIGLSELGQKLVNTSNADGQREARRIALLNLKAYRELVDSFDGTELPQLSALSSRLQFDYGKSAEFAEKAAQAFVESLHHAGMVDGLNIVRKAGIGDMPPANADQEQASIPVQRDVVEDTDADDAELDRAFEAEDEPPHEEDPEQSIESTSRPGAAYPQPALSISVSLDLSKYRADEVIQILQSLRGFQ